VRQLLRPVAVIVASAVAASVPLVLVWPSSPAVAYAGTVTCKTLVTQGDSASTGFGETVLASCSRPAATGGSGTFTFNGPGPYTITWASGGTTTFTDNEAPSGPGLCPGGLRAGIDTGSVIAHGGPGSSIALGVHVSFETCFDLNAKVQYLVSGTKARF
jgi:hypothetical protein